MNLQKDLRYVSKGDFEAFGGRQERDAAWAPHGWLGKRVRTFLAATVSGRILFVHAGLLPRFLDQSGGLPGLNEGMKSAIATLPAQSSLSTSGLLEDSGPVWTRVYPEGQESEVCRLTQDVLQRTGALRMVVGHTIQQSAEGF